MDVRIVLAAGLSFLFAASGPAFAGDQDVIVGFKTSADTGIIRKHGGTAGTVLGDIRAVSARVPATAISKLRSDPNVAYVEEDSICEAVGKGGNGGGKGKPGGGDSSPPPQTTPWGITRVGAPVSGNTGSGVKVAVIDTGVDLDHSDLADNVKSGANFVAKAKSENDDNGHGTHVAGTIAALDNTIGVVGVAPQASIYPVKVLDRRGSGTYSAVVSGILWASDNGMQVANMSLSGPSSSTALQDACDTAESAGVLLVAASGNDGDGSTSTTETAYPAAYSSVLAVGATNSSDGLASFSNTGSHVYASGPGVSVLSCTKGNGYATHNGTSMASPHVAGVAALLWNALSSPTASSVKTEIKNRADDAGATGFDNGYGWGIATY